MISSDLRSDLVAWRAWRESTVDRPSPVPYRLHDLLERLADELLEHEPVIEQHSLEGVG